MLIVRNVKLDLEFVNVKQIVERGNKHHSFSFPKKNRIVPIRRPKKEKENNSIQHNINSNLLKMYQKELHSVDNIENLEPQAKGFSSSFSFTDFRHPKSYGIVPHKSLEGRIDLPQATAAFPWPVISVSSWMTKF